MPVIPPIQIRKNQQNVAQQNNEQQSGQNKKKKSKKKKKKKSSDKPKSSPKKKMDQTQVANLGKTGNASAVSAGRSKSENLPFDESIAETANLYINTAVVDYVSDSEEESTGINIAPGSALANSQVGSGIAAAQMGASVAPQNPTIAAAVENANELISKTGFDEILKDRFSGSLANYFAERAVRRSEYGLTVVAPDPEPGYATAKITVITNCGTSNQKQFTYLNQCVVTPPPKSNEEIFTEPDIVDAYEDCLTGIRDLFCKPITPSKGGPIGFDSLEIEEDYSMLSLQNGKLVAGSLVQPRYKIIGAGSYEIQIIAIEADEQFVLYSSGVVEVDTDKKHLSVEVIEPIIVEDSHESIRIDFIPRNTEGNADPIIRKIYQVKKVEINTSPPLFELKADNDLSDSQKELYVTISSSVDPNKTIRDLQQQNLLPIDPLRDKYKSFWILNETRTQYVYNTSKELPVITSTDLLSTLGGNYYYTEFINNSGRNFETEFITDITYEHYKPYTKKEFEKTERPFSSKIIDVHQEYNFYYKQYEDVQIDFSSNRENLLPNMYYLLLKEEGEKSQTISEVIKIDPDIDSVVTLTAQQNGISPITIESNYYDYFIQNYKNSTIEQDSELIKRTKNIVIPYSFLDKIEEFSKRNQSFPMFADIRFSTDHRKKVSRKIKNTSFGEWLLYNSINKFIDNNVEFIQSRQFLKQQISENGNYFTQTLRILDLQKLLYNNTEPQDNFLFLGNYKDFENKTSSGAEVEVEKVAFLEDVKQLIKENGRKYGDILIGKNCYKETLFYRIAKFSGETDSEAPVQNVWIARDPDREELRYVDTQLVYEKGYKYRIYSYDLVIGNEYAVRSQGEVETPNVPTGGVIGNRGVSIANPPVREVHTVKNSPPVQSGRVSSNINSFVNRKLNSYSKIEKKIEKPREDVKKAIDTVQKFNKKNIQGTPQVSVSKGGFKKLNVAAVQELASNLEIKEDQIVSSVQSLTIPQNIYTIRNNIKMFLIENVYDEFDVRIVDKPPVFPQVKLHTYMGVDNRLLILLNKSTSTNRQKEVIIKEEDRLVFEKTRRDQNLEPEELIEFSGDDLVKTYQIFRTTVAPKSYQDFSNATMFEDETLLDEAGINRRSNSASVIDKIKPNVKYYYTFRCVDIHGQISNPSEVYEVEIVNEAGAIYSNIVPYEFPKEEQGEATKKFKRFLMIKPNALQSYMDIDEKIQNYKDYERMGIKLGIKDDSIIDKKYKMRIVSKNSDKVYDINFSFGKIVKIIE